MPGIQASAEINREISKVKGSDASLSAQAIEERAFRACDLGSSACEFAFGETSVYLKDAEGNVLVDTFCWKEDCEMTSADLQASLDRLVAQRITRSKQAAAKK